MPCFLSTPPYDSGDSNLQARFETLLHGVGLHTVGAHYGGVASACLQQLWLRFNTAALPTPRCLRA